MGVLLAGCLGAGCAAPAEDDEDAVAEGDSAASASDLLFEGQVRGDALPDKTLHLTFDDGPGPRTQELAEYLREQGIRATFFVNGVNVGGRQKAVAAIAEGGHTLANHTQRHVLLPSLSHAAALDEIAATDALIRHDPSAPLYLRAPFAGWTESLQRSLERSSLREYVAPIHWDVGTRTTATSAADWDCWSKRYDVARCGDLYLAEIRAKGRGIVLLHDIHGKTVEMTKYLVPKLRAENYRFTTLAEVPAIRALASVTPDADGTTCFSGTLVARVPKGACVQSSYDDRWYRCTGADWTKSSATDTACADRRPR